MWAVFIIISIIFCAIFVYNSVADFLEYDVVTKVRIIHSDNLTFPAITICHFDEFFNRSINEVIKNCHFANSRCDASDFEIVDMILINQGFVKKCFKFNGGKNYLGDPIELKVSYEKGYSAGLILDLLLPEQSQLNYYINENRILPLVDEFKGVVKTGYGNYAFLAMDKLVEIRLGEPHNSCIKNLNSNETTFSSLLFDEIIKLNISYRREYCYQLCFLKYASNACNCSYNKTYNKNNAMCYNCFKKQISDFSFEERCAVYCPLECEMTYYSVNKDTHTVPSKLNQTSLAFYYEDLKYQQIDQIAKTLFSDIISNVGGTLGLFIGVSLLSFIEIFEVFAQLIIAFF